MARRARQIPGLQRREPKRSSYDRVLIVCEGSKTEPNYFRELVEHLRLNTANVEIDGDSDPSPKSVVAHAKRRYQQEEGFDRVFCVFDKDEHSTYQQAVRDLAAEELADVFTAITSVPCFEYWLLLHFIFTTKPYARSESYSPGQHVLRDLKAHLPAYSKGSQAIYLQLIPYTDLAIRYAERAGQQAAQNQTDNPTTQVHRLVSYLRALKNS
ncbi:MAG: RloB domain-containing protein [Caldilinea sp. CFX5]|nr:RloB domain-containing protein [Caldilinea sp. CFX5]